MNNEYIEVLSSTGKIEIEILAEIRVLVFPDSENASFDHWWVCRSVCEQNILRTVKAREMKL